MERFENDDEAFSIMNQSEIMEALGGVTIFCRFFWEELQQYHFWSAESEL